MAPVVYFADKSVQFESVQPADAAATTSCCVLMFDAATFSRSKVLKILESCNRLVVVAAQPEVAFARFAAEFTEVVAAGGIAVNAAGEWLMMWRNNRWDLPKGHLEAGETLAECAVREVEEETGVRSTVRRELCRTWHAYWFEKTQRWELKCTVWFELSALEPATLRPQTEEGIVAVRWCDAEAVHRNLRQAYPTIRTVAAAM